jgi:hypothetical protein
MLRTPSKASSTLAWSGSISSSGGALALRT